MKTLISKKNLRQLFLVFLVSFSTIFVLVGCFKGTWNENKRINVVHRDYSSGTRTGILEMLFGSKYKDLNLNIDTEQGSSGGVLNAVELDQQALGYDSFGLVFNRKVNIVKVDGVAPTLETVLSEEYKFSRPLSVLYRDQKLYDENSKGKGMRALMDFIYSRQGQSIAIQQGYVNFIPQDEQRDYLIDESLSHVEISVAGSTTVQPLMLRWAEAFKKIQPQIVVTVGGGGSGSGQTGIAKNDIDFGMQSAALTDEEVQKISDQAGTKVSNFTLAKDGIAIIVHSSNTTQNITTDQLKHLFDADSGVNFKSWKEMTEYGV